MHVKKGCLERRRQDIAVDGSRIEGSHKAWNTLQRACASGIEMFGALSRDFVLRRNVRIITMTGCHRGPATGFVATTLGSHHIRLQNRINTLFTTLSDRERTWGRPGFAGRPVLKSVNSGETFGLVVSDHNLTFGGLLQIKDEPNEDEKLEELICNPEEELDVAGVLRDLDIDPALLNQPEFSPTVPHPPLLVDRSSTILALTSTGSFATSSTYALESVNTSDCTPIAEKSVRSQDDRTNGPRQTSGSEGRGLNGRMSVKGLSIVSISEPDTIS